MAVINEETRRVFFGGEQAVGEYIEVKGHSFRVVGGCTQCTGIPRGVLCRYLGAHQHPRNGRVTCVMIRYSATLRR